MKTSAVNSQQLLQVMPVNVITCDKNTHVITFANSQSKKTLNHLQKLLPRNVTGDNIVGQPADILRGVSGQSKELLSNLPSLPHEKIVALGHEFLKLSISDMPGSGGTLMIMWEVVTETERLKRMADKMPINLMMCDPVDFNIVYLNETSLKTLREIEHLLPIKADEVLGSCIDVFHKEPSYQREILKDPSNLPHRGRIQLGDQQLELNVSAIVDDDGSYLGPMVSWRVMTDESRLTEKVTSISGTVAAAATELLQTADNLGQMTKNASERTEVVSEASTKTSNNVSSIASAIEEMTSSIQEISEQMANSRNEVEKAVDLTTKADKASGTLAEAAGSIDKVVQLIKDISSQINLLALNATIEAARAGEAGKGFAVVASEVKELAGQTNKATEEISGNIANIQGVSKEVVESLTSIREAVETVNQYSASVAAAVEEQSSAAEEISNNMQVASDGVNTINENVTNIASDVQHADQSASELKEAAQSLSAQAEGLNQEIAEFLEGTR